MSSPSVLTAYMAYHQMNLMSGGCWVAYFTKDGEIILVDLIISLSLPGCFLPQEQAIGPIRYTHYLDIFQT